MPEEIRHPAVRYEPTDASLKAILIILAGALVLGIFIYVIVWQFFVGYERRLAAERKSMLPLAPTPSTALPPEPRLEQLDRLEGSDVANAYARLKAKEDVLRRYGKTEEPGYVHIPIEEAMKQLAGRLPVRKAEPAGPRHDLGLIDAGAPNSGRLFRKEPR